MEIDQPFFYFFRDSIKFIEKMGDEIYLSFPVFLKKSANLAHK